MNTNLTIKKVANGFIVTTPDGKQSVQERHENVLVNTSNLIADDLKQMKSGDTYTVAIVTESNPQPVAEATGL